ncbi:MAG: hypothetical protein WC824_08270 [Bacteroidota bacterium]|jgi:hypothetical protein
MEKIRIQVSATVHMTSEDQPRVFAALMLHHTGRPKWPLSVSSDQIPNGKKAGKAQAKALVSRTVTITYDVDSEGEWHLVSAK